MTPEQYRAAALAISDHRWMLAAALSSAKIAHTKESKAQMRALTELQDVLTETGVALLSQEELNS